MYGHADARRHPVLLTQTYIFGWFVLVSAVCAVAETKWPASSQPGLVHRLHNFSIVLVVTIVMSAFNGALNYLPDFLFTRGLTGLVFGRWQVGSGPWAIVLATFVYAFVWDFFQYWVHRLQHAVPLLWETHALHHDDEHLNATTSLRNPALARFVTYFLVSIPTIAICGGQLLNIYGSMFLFATWGFFNHANVRLNLGPLTPVVSGPQWHRIHHGKDSRYHNRNFAAFFPIFDLAFGTYLAPEPDEYPSTGLAGRTTLPVSLRDFAGSIFSIAPATLGSDGARLTADQPENSRRGMRASDRS
jgi:sterol desaturase/sphingolipid hydroxylase (fatty acid hydroxylase superfamily)